MNEIPGGGLPENEQIIFKASKKIEDEFGKEGKSFDFWAVVEASLDISYAEGFSTKIRRQEFMGIEGLFDAIRFRTDGGFSSDAPNPLAEKIARRVIERDLFHRDYLQAITHATEAHLPKEYMDELAQLYPASMMNDENKQVLSGLRNSAKQFLAVWQ